MIRSRRPCWVRSSSAPSVSSDSARPAIRPVADADDHIVAQGGAMFLPFVRHSLELARADPLIIAVQFAQDGHGQPGAIMALAGFDFQRSGDLAQVGRKIARAQVHIHADAEDDVL